MKERIHNIYSVFVGYTLFTYVLKGKTGSQHQYLAQAGAKVKSTHSVNDVGVTTGETDRQKSPFAPKYLVAYELRVSIRMYRNIGSE